MRGFGGVSKTEFYRLSYREIFESYFAEFTDDGELVPLRRRYKRLRERRFENEHGRPRLPLLDELGVPEDVLQCGVPLDYTRLFWAIWRRRGLPTEDIEKRWWIMAEQCRPKQYNPPAHVMAHRLEQEGS